MQSSAKEDQTGIRCVGNTTVFRYKQNDSLILSITSRSRRKMHALCKIQVYMSEVQLFSSSSGSMIMLTYNFIIFYQQLIFFRLLRYFRNCKAM